MKLKSTFAPVVILTVALVLTGFKKGEEKEPWTEQQLMAPAALAEKINKSETADIVVFNIGPSGEIKGAVNIGATQEAENLALLKKELEKLPKETEVVIYCGCCPFNHCPNIRPAFELLNEMRFTNAKLLNLPKNLKVDWINKGYPMQN